MQDGLRHASWSECVVYVEDPIFSVGIGDGVERINKEAHGAIIVAAKREQSIGSA